MKKFLTLVLAAGVLVAISSGISSVAYANVCAMDQAPAATLLYPFVVYDYNAVNDKGDTTLFAVTNVSNEAVIVHFTLWTDYSTHVLDWDVMLTGYDVQTMNIRDILKNGELPTTWPGSATSPNYPDKAANAGVHEGGPEALGSAPYRLPDPVGVAGFQALPGCASFPPIFSPTNIIPTSTLQLIQQFLQASQSVTRGHTDCNGSFFSRNDWFEMRTTADSTWMYITADVVNDCSQAFPDTDPNYFGQGGTGLAGDENVLMGDIFYVNDENNLSEAIPAVHLEADPNIVSTLNPETDNPQTFYHQYSQGKDDREPLPNAYGFRYLGAGSTDFGTNVRVFKRASTNPPFNTGDTPGHIEDLMLGGAQTSIPTSMYAKDCQPYIYFAWDEDEQVVTSPPVPPWSCPPNDPNCTAIGEPNELPLETQEVAIDKGFVTPDMNGWILLVWPNNVQSHSDLYQTYVSVKYNAFGRYSAAMPAAVLSNYNCFANQVLPNLGIGQVFR